MKIEITDIPTGSKIKTLECKIDFTSGASETKVVLDSNHKPEPQTKPETRKEMNDMNF